MMGGSNCPPTDVVASTDPAFVTFLNNIFFSDFLQVKRLSDSFLQDFFQNRIVKDAMEKTGRSAVP